MSNLNNFLQSGLQESFFNLTLYAVFGIAVFWLVWKGLKNVWRWRRIQPKSEQRKHFFSHDVLFSIGSVLLAGVLTAFITFLDQLGFMKLYWDFNAHSSVWGGLQLLVLIFFYDAYFYWTHRWMHHPKIYRWVHKTHHKSTDPSPLTIFAFHPLENLIEFLPFLILPMLIPIYWPILYLSDLKPSRLIFGESSAITPRSRLRRKFQLFVLGLIRGAAQMLDAMPLGERGSGCSFIVVRYRGLRDCQTGSPFSSQRSETSSKSSPVSALIG